MRFALVAFFIAASVGYAAGRWDGQFIPNRTRTLTATSGADACTAIPPGAYMHTTCDGDAYVGFGILLSDAGVSIGTGVSKCLDRDGGVACDIVLFSTGAPSFAQTMTGINQECVRATDAGTRTCQVAYSQNN